jgi:hypothetical protein
MAGKQPESVPGASSVPDNGRHVNHRPNPFFKENHSMRIVTIIGVLLILAGGWVTINGGSFTTQEEVLDIGVVEVTAERERPIPLWAGLAAIVVGAGLVAVDMRGKKAS